MTEKKKSEGGISWEYGRYGALFFLFCSMKASDALVI
jgi:hypothetical protein